MIQKTSVLIYIKTNVNLTSASQIEVSFSQKNRQMFVKTGGAVVAYPDNIVVEITKDEATLFEPGRMVAFDVTAYFDDFTKITSDIMYRSFERFGDIHATANFNTDGIIAAEKIREEFEDISEELDLINGEVI